MKFRSKAGDFTLPMFFPDATRAVVKTLDSEDIKNTKTPGILVNTYHLYLGLGSRVLKKYGEVSSFMNWDGAVISDSGGFQVMSIIKSRRAGGRGSISDQGIKVFSKKKTRIFTPEKSIEFQFELGTDLMVVLDDFTPPNVSEKVAERTVKRTIEWAKRSKDEFERQCKKRKLKNKPYLIGVVQGGEYLDLREYCTKELVEIGFDGLGYGGWPINSEGEFNYEVARVIAENSPKDYLLYGLGIGKPDEIVGCFKLGFNIFDCVLPTRDGRHGRLYVYDADSINSIDIHKPDFYKFYVPIKQKYYSDTKPVSTACDCLLCTKYSRAYLGHLFRVKDMSAMRLATIHNLRFYSILMEKLREAST